MNLIKPPYLLTHFDYGWSRKYCSDKVYISAVLFCYRLPTSHKLPLIGLSSGSRFLGLNIYGRRSSIEAELMAIGAQPPAFGEPWDKSLLAAQLVLNALSVTSQPTTRWGAAIDRAVQSEVLSTVHDNLMGRMGAAKGYQGTGWQIGDQLEAVAALTSQVVSPDMTRGQLDWLWQGEEGLTPEIVAEPVKTLRDNPTRRRRSIDLS